MESLQAISALIIVTRDVVAVAGGEEYGIPLCQALGLDISAQLVGGVEARLTETAGLRLYIGNGVLYGRAAAIDRRHNILHESELAAS
jgi:hypothetical protein